MYLQTTATQKISKLRKRIRGVGGGTAASKTISILMWLIDRALTYKKPEILSVVSESFPHLKRGAIRDFLNIMEANQYFQRDRWNKTDYVYTFETGSKIEFFSADQPGKVRGPRRDILFINEANNISYETYTQLEIRTKKIIWLDWNPVAEFWWYEAEDGGAGVKDREDADFITLTYKDNEALTPDFVKALEMRKNNKNWWKVYGLGLLGELEARIYTGWTIIDELPAKPYEPKVWRYGLDFGYSNDPATGVGIYKYEGGYILDEIFYQKGLSNKAIADIFKNIERRLIIADSAEPKSIDEIKSYGLTILPSQKGKDSVLHGIQYLQEQKVSITKRSINLIKEYRNYMWITDKDGKIINEPDDRFNHCLSGDTFVWTINGKIKIKNLVGKMGYLLTPYGVRKFYNVHKSGEMNILELKTDYGLLRCTEDHEIQMNNGMWKKAIDIKPHELIQWIYESKCNIKNNSRICWNPLLSLWRKIFPIQRNGFQFASTSGSLGVPQWNDPYRVYYSSQRSKQIKQSDRKFRIDFERKTSKFTLDKRKEKLGKEECCRKSYAKSEKMAQVKRRKKMAQGTRIGTGVRIKNKKKIFKKIEVFDLSVDEFHCFIVNEGFVVRNCMDAIRYGISSGKKVEWKPNDPGGVKPLYDNLPG